MVFVVVTTVLEVPSITKVFAPVVELLPVVLVVEEVVLVLFSHAIKRLIHTKRPQLRVKTVLFISRNFRGRYKILKYHHLSYFLLLFIRFKDLKCKK